MFGDFHICALKMEEVKKKSVEECYKIMDILCF